MCFKTLLSKAFCAFAGAALIVAGCDKAQTPPTTNDDEQPQETVKHFTVTLTDITTVSCVVSIEKDDPDQLFYYEIVRKHSFEKLGNTFQERAKAYYDGEIDFWINDMGVPTMEEILGYIASKDDLLEFPRENLCGNTPYVLIVGYITPEGKPAGDFESVEFETLTPEASDNKLEITVSDIEARSAHVSITTSNEDQYTFRYFPSTQFGDLSGAELAREMLYYYYWLDTTKNGNYEEDLDGLKANTKYIAAAVGCTDHAATTELVTVEFTTGKAGDAHKWNYTVNFTDGEYTGYKIDAEITPNDDTIDYCYEFIPAEYTQEAFTKQFYENLKLMEQSGLDKESYIKLFGVYGPDIYTDCSVKPGQSYRIAAVPVDPETGDFLGVIFSQTVEAPTPERTDISISISWDKYFDGAELPELWLGEGAIFDPVITTTSEKYFFGVYVDNGTTYSDEDIIAVLLENGKNQSAWSKTLTVPFDKDAALYAVTVDENGLFGPVFRKMFKLSKEGVSPAEEYGKTDETDETESKVENAAVKKADTAKTDSKKAVAEKIRKNWFGSAPLTFDAK